MSPQKLEKTIQDAKKRQVLDLDLSYEGIKELPQNLGELAQLRMLKLSSNDLTDLPDSLGQLAQLQTLDVSLNQLTLLPESLGQLAKVQTLDLSGNQFTQLSESFGQLAQLQTLDLSINRLTMLPESFVQLTQLQTLDLSHNQLTQLPGGLLELAKEKRLHHLFLHGNDLLGLPPEILGPPWEDCENISQHGRQEPARPLDVLEYYFRIRSGKDGVNEPKRMTRTLNEIKLIFVGRGGAGKTSLVQRLVTKGEPKTKRTEGIAVTNWKVPADDASVRLNVWDFGGQEIMHATHQFFLTERSIYVLVVSNREGMAAADAEYWLKLIQSFGGDSPVLLVRNKIEETSFELDEEVLREKYPMLRGSSVATDALMGTGCEELETRIRETVIAADGWRVEIDAAWWAVKEELETLPKSHICREEFNAICERHGEKKPEEQERLARILKQLGVIVQYWDDPRLRETAVLRPSWLTGGIYLLLNDPELAKSRGVTLARDLERILPAKDYPPSQHNFLLEVMRKFRLSHEVPKHSETWLIPELLPEAQPPGLGEWPEAECLALRYKYIVQPEGLVPRLIAQAFPLVSEKQQWRFGVVLAMDGAKARVRADRADRCLTVLVRDGKAEARKRLLSYIRACFDEMHHEFERLEIETIFRPEGEASRWQSYDRLVGLEVMDERTLASTEYGTIDKAKVQAELAKVEVPAERSVSVDTNSSRIAFLTDPRVSVFVSYCHADRELKAELDIRLKILQRRLVISRWDDGMIPEGEPWNEQILNHLREAKIILLLVSPEFMASDYITEYEVPLAMELHEQKKATVIPIKLRTCNWKPEPYSALQGPHGGKSIVGKIDTKHARDEAWLAVEEAIERTAVRKPRK